MELIGVPSKATTWPALRPFHGPLLRRHIRRRNVLIHRLKSCCSSRGAVLTLCRCCALPSPHSHEKLSSQFQGGEVVSGDVSRSALIWRAIKLPIYTVALVPLSVGSAAAYLETGMFDSRQYLLLLLSSVLIIGWLNLSNDVYDFDTGADRDKKESVVNLIESRAVTYLAANVSLVLGLAGVIWSSMNTKDIRCIFLLAIAVFCGYIYQCPPFRLSYKGLGEPLCFASFGPLATIAFYISQSSSKLGQLVISRAAVSASILVGITTTLILFCSHFHQIEGDQAVGKMSPLVSLNMILEPYSKSLNSHVKQVKLGTKNGSKVVVVAVGALYFLLLSFGFFKALPWISVILCSMTLPLSKMVVDYVEENHNDKTKIFMSKYYCVRLHTLFGAALTAGLVLARL